jgi:hypothetical protein
MTVVIEDSSPAVVPKVVLTWKALSVFIVNPDPGPYPFGTAVWVFTAQPLPSQPV